MSLSIHNSSWDSTLQLFVHILSMLVRHFSSVLGDGNSPIEIYFWISRSGCMSWVLKLSSVCTLIIHEQVLFPPNTFCNLLHKDLPYVQNLFSHLFIPRLCSLWNDLPLHIVQDPNTSVRSGTTFRFNICIVICVYDIVTSLFVYPLVRCYAYHEALL